MKVLKQNQYNFFDDPNYGTFYQKAIGGDDLRYYIEVHELDFRRFKQNGYEGEDFRYDVRMSFYQQNEDYLEIRFGIHDFGYDEELVKLIEAKCERLFTVNDGKPIGYKEPFGFDEIGE